MSFLARLTLKYSAKASEFTVPLICSKHPVPEVPEQANKGMHDLSGTFSRHIGNWKSCEVPGLHQRCV